MIPIIAPARDFVQEHTHAAKNNVKPPASVAAWRNTGGYTLRKVRDKKYLWTTKAVYECRLTQVMPLQFMDSTGNLWRTRHEFETDMGSIPLTAQLIIPKDRGLLSYLMHDDACITGKLWCKEAGTSTWVLTAMGRSDRDNLLYDCLIAEGISKCQARAVWLGIRGWALASHQWS
jgi:hypothetical protein